MSGLNPIGRPTKAGSTEVLLCLHYTDDCCHYAGYPGATENALDGQFSLPGAGELLVVVVIPLDWARVTTQELIADGFGHINPAVVACYATMMATFPTAISDL
ncbi:hypothetical protein N7449_001345 [Penicillium cf. viridicatum]|uniref:Uncharacterized protein n=1 Tax=Penicillium cf. viridicatum TaxID=2972119 RepID=A0A9W9T9D1_9EURO|nr:hypothetical protein N7449_001345 [Penicillium cf. viridicatum]